MLRILSNMIGYHVIGRGAAAGRVFDFYLDDRSWRLRYLVVETGAWFNRHRVLLPPGALDSFPADSRCLHVSLSAEEVRRSPGMDSEMPVSRRQELSVKSLLG